MKCNDIKLDKAHYFIKMALQKEGLNPNNVTFDKTEMFANEIVYRLKYELMKQSNIKVIKKIFKQKLEQSLKIKTKTPTSLWQMFKEQYMPKWFNKKYPVKYDYAYHDVKREVDINFETEVGIDVIYPKAVLPQDNYTANFRFMDGHNFTIQEEVIEVSGAI